MYDKFRLLTAYNGDQFLMRSKISAPSPGCSF